jgi:hypothetical protein
MLSDFIFFERTFGPSFETFKKNSLVLEYMFWTQFFKFLTWVHSQFKYPTKIKI